MTDVEQIKRDIVELAPWHINVQVTDGISTQVAVEEADAGNPEIEFHVSFLDPRDGFVKTMQTMYPAGLQGRSFLDCACNCGAYSFWARELGAGRTFGFDVREHWIQQANFLLKHRGYEDMHFGVHDLMELPKLDLPQFDVTLFKGIFYHLPDPIHGLKIAGDLTKELLILNTAVSNEFDPEPHLGGLFLQLESADSFMSGVHRLNWYPTGPKVLTQILYWMGFDQIKLHYHIKSLPLTKDVGTMRGQKGRLEIMAARRKGLLGRLQTIIETEAAGNMVG